MRPRFFIFHMVIMLFNVHSTRGQLAVSGSTVTDSILLHKKHIVLPLLIYTPETHFGGGALGVMLWKVKDQVVPTRTSNAELVMLYTSKSQTIILPRFTIFTKGEKYLIDGLGQGLIDFKDFYFGIGNQTPFTNREIVTYNLVALESKFMRKIYPDKKLFVGIEERFFHYYDLRTTTGGLLENEKTTGYHGSTTLGIGPVITWDSRDNVLNPSKGYLIDFRVAFHDKVLGATTRYNRVLVDVRKFMNVNKARREILAFQFYGNFVDGDAPFKELSELGGARLLRGYYRGRFRDRYFMMFQSEYRVPVYKWFGMAAFAGLGNVFNSISAFTDSIKPSYGAGVRVKLNKKENLNLRMDYGAGEPGRHGYFYLGFAESF